MFGAATARHFLALGVAVLLSLPVAGAVSAAGRIRIAAQKTGTLAWELEVIRTHGLDRQADLDLQVVELASPEAGKIALRSGSADLIVSDWLWVARERAMGDKLVFYPYSSQIGAIMVPADSGIAGIADLKGRKLAVAGGQLDKNWLLLQADARRGGVDLKTQATVVYGAPPLLSLKALQREQDATLTFWNFCAELEGKGLKRGIDMEAVERRLGASGPVAMLGYVFDGSWAAKRIGVTDTTSLDIYRRRYSEGIPRRPVADEARDAIGLYRVLAEAGGPELVGTAREMDRGTFYDPERTD
jgi:NitT/TauT family transport system substrate-binding protein